MSQQIVRSVTPATLLHHANMTMQMSVIQCSAPRMSGMSRHWQTLACLMFEAAAYIIAQQPQRATNTLQRIQSLDEDALEYLFTYPAPEGAGLFYL